MTGITYIKPGLRVVFAIAVLAAALVLPAQALAKDCANVGSDPTEAQYCSVSGANTGGGEGPETAVEDSPETVEALPAAASTPNSGTPSGTVAVESSSGSLPFTGLDVGILLLVAAVLTGTGLALRRLSASGAHRS